VDIEIVIGEHGNLFALSVEVDLHGLITADWTALFYSSKPGPRIRIPQRISSEMLPVALLRSQDVELFGENRFKVTDRRSRTRELAKYWPSRVPETSNETPQSSDVGRHI
jgi:hypothetical protein